MLNIGDLLGVLLTNRLLFNQSLARDRLQTSDCSLGKRLLADILGQHVYFHGWGSPPSLYIPPLTLSLLSPKTLSLSLYLCLSSSLLIYIYIQGYIYLYTYIHPHEHTYTVVLSLSLSLYFRGEEEGAEEGGKVEGNRRNIYLYTLSLSLTRWVLKLTQYL